jgi:glycosyltransferase involved in cell wall biosynthesis
MHKPRVTVIMATYNWSTVLPFSIGSVLAQTFRDFELLVIGDGCTDDSEAVVTGMGDPRIRWINLPQNTGHQSGPNNRGLQEARGDLIAYLGHDDLWLPHHLECMAAALDTRGAALAYSLVGGVAENASIATPIMPVNENSNPAPPSGTAHTRAMTDAVGGWADYRSVSMVPEAELWMRARAAGFTFQFVPRLTAVKFSAAGRRNVYRVRPCHEQAAWSARIAADPHFEATHLVQMIASGEGARATPGRLLFPLSLRELARRTWRRTAALLPRRKGAQIDNFRSYKGL